MSAPPPKLYLPQPMRVYVASSWRNRERQQAVVNALRDAGLHAYDFTLPDAVEGGFSWRDVDADWPWWNPEQIVQGLAHPTAQTGYARDMAALSNADACVLVMPAGRSAHAELGWAVGAGKYGVVLLPEDERVEAELMWNMADLVTSNVAEVIGVLTGTTPPFGRPSWG